MSNSTTPSREEIGERYFATLPYPPYPVQEEALLAWFLSPQGILMCAPTGTGKTLVAQGALYEALTHGKRAYYTTPLIALTEQKFHELQEATVAWGFSADDVGLVTGNRRVNSDAKILVVVAEILLNRLLNPVAFPFDDTEAVVMDEFHSFNDPERGIVWELTLGLLPKHVRLMLLSATVGNAAEFIVWLEKSHGRKLDLVRGTERKVPLEYHWVADKLLGDQLVEMTTGNESERKTPALVFCFNREMCWNVGEQLKGLDLLGPEQRGPLHEEIERNSWDRGVGPKLRQMLWRGVGVHHAGLLPKYRRIVEKLFLQKLLPVVLCTETLSAGLNLPCRSVVLTELLKGPHTQKKLINSSIAHQIFGRAGRPQFDAKGYVFAMAHEDDVKIGKWEEKLKTFPESPKDPGMIKAKKAFMKKKPTRRTNEQYWNDAQFQKLINAPPSRLASHGPVTWRLLAYLLKLSPDVERLRQFVRKRLHEPGQIERGEKDLVTMLVTLHRAGFVSLDPLPPADTTLVREEDLQKAKPTKVEPQASGMLGGLLDRAGITNKENTAPKEQAKGQAALSNYVPLTATPLPLLDKLFGFRSIHPIYGCFLLDMLGTADENERMLALESVLTLPRPILRWVKPPTPEEMPPGPMEKEKLDPILIEKGLLLAHFADPSDDPDDEDEDEEAAPPSLADKLRFVFDDLYPGLHDVQTQTIWAAGEILRFGGDFDKFVRTFKLVKQEGIIFRHLLRMILLCGEFGAQTPSEGTLSEWRNGFSEIARRLTLACREVDPVSTARTLQHAHDLDFVDPATVHQAPADEWESEWESMLKELLPEGTEEEEESEEA
ncbi:DEAD/DEAH box helicase [bacterium]|nr:DEAD/DEAH box helicase [bacterium]